MTTKIEHILPDGIFTRLNNGKPMYSQVLVVQGTPRFIYISGQIARDTAGKIVGKGDMRSQIEKVAENLDICLKAAGASLADIIKTTAYVTDIDEYSKHSDLRVKYFGAALPASSTVEVRRLAGADYLVEIEAVAVVG